MAQLTLGRSSAVTVAVDLLRISGRRRRLLQRRFLISIGVAIAAMAAFIPFPRTASSQAPAVCLLPSNAVSISQTNGAPADPDVHMEKDPTDPTKANATVHLYLRNEGTTEPNQLCATAHLSDPKDVPETVFISISQPGQDVSSLTFEKNTSCFKIDPSWEASQEIPIDINLRVDQALIPLSGPINLSATATLKEAPDPKSAATNGKPPTTPGGHNQPVNALRDCVSTSKLVTRSVLLLPSITSGWLKLPLFGALGIALAYSLISFVVLRNRLGDSVGGPQWSFTTSFATNFTIGTGLLTPLLGVNVISDALHYLTKFQYALLAILFAALLLFAPAVFSFFSSNGQTSTPAGQTSIMPVGSVGLFLATSALMIGAVVGQLFTVGLVIAEIKFRGYIDSASMWVILCLLAVAGVGTIVSAVITIRFLLDQPPQQTGLSIEHVQSIGHKFVSLQSEADLRAASSQLFTDNDRKVIEHVVKGKPLEARTWRMF